MNRVSRGGFGTWLGSTFPRLAPGPQREEDSSADGSQTLGIINTVKGLTKMQGPTISAPPLSNPLMNDLNPGSRPPGLADSP
jgi:hypothetical protein